MPPEPTAPSTKDWLEKAQDDLEVAQHLLGVGHWEASAFHAQQAAEKALKAVQIHRNGTYEKTHDLTFLAKVLKAGEKISEHAEFLTTYYIVPRYPDVAGGVSQDDARDAVERANKVVSWAQTQLS